MKFPSSWNMSSVFITFYCHLILMCVVTWHRWAATLISNIKYMQWKLFSSTNLSPLISNNTNQAVVKRQFSWQKCVFLLNALSFKWVFVFQRLDIINGNISLKRIIFAGVLGSHLNSKPPLWKWINFHFH